MSAGRLLAIGDIHGCETALNALLAEVQLQPGDTLVSLGDYVDRGPDSRGVVDTMIDLLNSGLLAPLRGNHELMMLRARDSLSEEKFWKSFGGVQTLESYGPPNRPARLGDVPDRHWRFFARECRDWFEDEDFIFAHAGVNPILPLDRQSEDDLFWQSLTDRGPHISGKTVICGHSVQHAGEPFDLGHTICIDTGSYCGGWLTCLDVRSRQYWQANQAGATRRDELF